MSANVLASFARKRNSLYTAKVFIHTCLTLALCSQRSRVCGIKSKFVNSNCRIQCYAPQNRSIRNYLNIQFIGGANIMRFKLLSRRNCSSRACESVCANERKFTVVEPVLLSGCEICYPMVVASRCCSAACPQHVQTYDVRSMDDIRGRSVPLRQGVRSNHIVRLVDPCSSAVSVEWLSVASGSCHNATLSLTRAQFMSSRATYLGGRNYALLQA